MKQRYSIMGVEYGSDHEVEIVQVNANPEDVRKALGQKTLKISNSIYPGGTKKKVPRYSWLRIVENNNG